jgi:hypothetical protein
MTTAQAVGAVSREAAEWYAIDWQATNRNVRRLQVRIVQATKESRWGKVRALQRLLTLRNRVSSTDAFEGLELGEGNPSRPVLRGPGGRKAARLLGSYYRARSVRGRELGAEEAVLGNLSTGNYKTVRKYFSNKQG